jgi:hypothetical protein
MLAFSKLSLKFGKSAITNLFQGEISIPTPRDYSNHTFKSTFSRDLIVTL